MTFLLLSTEKHIVAHFHYLFLQGHVMVQGTYSELQTSGLDIVSLLRSDAEAHSVGSCSVDPEELSLRSQWTICSHGSDCSSSSLLLPDSSCTDQLHVGIFPKD